MPTGYLPQLPNSVPRSAIIKALHVLGIDPTVTKSVTLGHHEVTVVASVLAAPYEADQTGHLGVQRGVLHGNEMLTCGVTIPIDDDDIPPAVVEDEQS